jgi:hypothetical protein
VRYDSAYKRPGRHEISAWLDRWIARYSSFGDPFAIPIDDLMTLVCRNLGWYWNVKDVGRAPCRHTGEPSTIEGYYAFLRETMAAKKARRDKDSAA